MEQCGKSDVRLSRLDQDLRWQRLGPEATAAAGCEAEVPLTRLLAWASLCVPFDDYDGMRGPFAAT